jgi:hypothetical protein
MEFLAREIQMPVAIDSFGLGMGSIIGYCTDQTSLFGLQLKVGLSILTLFAGRYIPS